MPKKIFLLFVIIIFIVRDLNAQTYRVEQVFYLSRRLKIEQNGKYGLADQNGNILVPIIYDKVNDFYNGFSKVVKQGKVGFVNMKAEEIIPCMYEKDTQMITGAVIEYAIEADSKRESINVKIDEVREGFSENMVCVIKNGKYGFVNKENKMVIPFQYEGADNFYNGMAIVKQKGKYGAIDTAGQIRIPAIYDLLVWDFSTDAVLYAQKDEKSILLDKNGNRMWKRGNE